MAYCRLEVWNYLIMQLGAFKSGGCIEAFVHFKFRSHAYLKRLDDW